MLHRILGIVGWLGTVFRTGGNLAFSLLATGIVAVLFQPLRERIQRAGLRHNGCRISRTGKPQISTNEDLGFQLAK